MGRLNLDSQVAPTLEAPDSVVLFEIQAVSVEGAEEQRMVWGMNQKKTMGGGRLTSSLHGKGMSGFLRIRVSLLNRE